MSKCDRAKSGGGLGKEISSIQQVPAIDAGFHLHALGNKQELVAVEQYLAKCCQPELLHHG